MTDTATIDQEEIEGAGEGPNPVARAPERRARTADGDCRHFDPQHCAPVDLHIDERIAGRDRMDTDRLYARADRPGSLLRTDQRCLRAQAALHYWRVDLRRGEPTRGAVAIHALADRRSRDSGTWRRAHLEQHAGDHHRHLPRGETGRGDGCSGHSYQRWRGRWADARRFSGYPFRLGIGFLHQRTTRALRGCLRLADTPTAPQ